MNEDVTRYYDITDFYSICNDDDFKDLSFKKETVIAGTILVASLLFLGFKIISKR